MALDPTQIQEIETFLLSIADSEEYHSLEYLVFTIRRTLLDYLSNTRLNNFKIPTFLRPFAEFLAEQFTSSGISADAMMQYMLDNDSHGWVKYFYCIAINPTLQTGTVKVEGHLFFLIMTGFVFDNFRTNILDLSQIVNEEEFSYETNQYNLSIVQDVEFRQDYFIFDGKAYLYSLLTDTSPVVFGDTMPGFARIITDQVHTGDLLLRLDERLALPKEQAISYSSLDFERYRGPQFHFDDCNFQESKTLIVHIDSNTNDKLLMVVKKDYDSVRQLPFLHIELEALPYVTDKAKYPHIISTFLHGMYYPDIDCFTHIDCTRNQYPYDDYVKKFDECAPGVSIDFYADKDMHYKIWCIENGSYSRETWYQLMMVSLPPRYRPLLDEILE